MTAILEPAVALAPSFRAWQRHTLASGLLPVIAVGGTRGKSTVVRMLNAIFDAAHLRTATWTNLGIEVRGRKQQGELAAWGTTMQRLAAGTVDVAIQELHWSTINAVGLPAASYPLVALTNIWPDESDDDQSRHTLARHGAERLTAASASSGHFVSTCDDSRVADVTSVPWSHTILTARSSSHPHLVNHVGRGFHGMWIQESEDTARRQGMMIACEGARLSDIMHTSDIGGSADGRARFQVSNAMIAASLALATGIDIETIRCGLQAFESTPDLLPASFNLHQGPEITAVVNRMEPPAITRSVIRAINPSLRRRQMTVFGDLDGMTLEEAHDIGRHVGRTHGAVLLHSQTDERLVQALRSGIAADDFPPLFISMPTERRTLNRVMAIAQPNDVIVVFTADDGRTANRTLARFLIDQSAAD